MPKITKLSSVLGVSPAFATGESATTTLASAAKQALIESGVLAEADGVLTWRAGHLEHVARCYQADAVIALRDYADDIATAQTFTPELWAALVGAE